MVDYSDYLTPTYYSTATKLATDVGGPFVRQAGNTFVGLVSTQAGSTRTTSIVKFSASGSVTEIGRAVVDTYNGPGGAASGPFYIDDNHIGFVTKFLVIVNTSSLAQVGKSSELVSDNDGLLIDADLRRGAEGVYYDGYVYALMDRGSTSTQDMAVVDCQSLSAPSQISMTFFTSEYKYGGLLATNNMLFMANRIRRNRDYEFDITDPPNIVWDSMIQAGPVNSYEDIPRYTWGGTYNWFGTSMALSDVNGYIWVAAYEDRTDYNPDRKRASGAVIANKFGDSRFNRAFEQSEYIFDTNEEHQFTKVIPANNSQISAVPGEHLMLVSTLATDPEYTYTDPHVAMWGPGRTPWYVGQGSQFANEPSEALKAVYSDPGLVAFQFPIAVGGLVVAQSNDGSQGYLASWPLEVDPYFEEVLTAPMVETRGTTTVEVS